MVHTAECNVAANLFATTQVGSSFPVLRRKAKVCFEGGIGAVPDELLIAIYPVVI